MELPQPMDLSSDEERARRKIFVKTCPYCNDEYVIPIVFVSHLAGHIQHLCILTRITVCIGVFGRILRLSPAHCPSAEPSSG